MTPSAFLKNVQEMDAFPEEFVEYLVDRVSDFSAAQREALISKLQPIHAGCADLLQESIELYGKATEMIQSVMRTELPKRMKAAEASENSSDLAGAENNLQLS